MTGGWADGRADGLACRRRAPAEDRGAEPRIADANATNRRASLLLRPAFSRATVDVMDNHYVPNLTIGLMVCDALRKHGVTAPIDVHLMVSPVDRIVEDFAKAGASYITFHPEASDHVDRTLQLIKSYGCKAGLVFNPATSLDAAKYVLDKCDIILLMSVNPGFGGQSFIPGVMDKIKEARKMIDESGYDIRLEIDGGVNPNNIAEIAEAGVDMFVAGSAILKEPRTEDAYKATIDTMREKLASVKVSA